MWKAINDVLKTKTTKKNILTYNNTKKNILYIVRVYTSI